MAYVDRFIFRFNSVSGKAVRIAIADNDYTGAAVERRLGGSPQLRCELSGNIHGMSLEIPAECKVDDEFAVLYTSDPTRFAVRLEVDNVVVWRGFVTPELYAAPWVDPPYDVQITATDGLGELKMKEWPAIGSRTLKEILDTVLGATGLALGIRIISAAANDIAAAADLLTGTTVNLDHMAGKSYYDVLDGLLGSLHCTISQRGGAWLLVRETDVTSLTSGGQVSDTSGNTYPVKSFGSSKTHDCWPVGRLTTEIVPAKSVVEVECPNHLASLIADPDMELNLWQTNGSWTGEDGGYYTLDLNEYISQVITVANASRDADPGFRIKVSSRHTTPFGVGIMRLTVMATGRDPRSGSDKTLYLKEVTTQGRTQMEWVTEESHFDDGLGLPRTLDHQDCKEFETDIFRLPTSFNPLKSITVKVTAGKSTVCVHSVHIECMSVYDKAVTRLVMDNGARGDESNSPLFADSFVGNKGNFLLTNSLRGVAGAIVRTWSSDAIPSVPYGEWLSKDMALSVATPRLRMSGRLFTVTSLPALFYSNKGLSYITEEWSLDLIEDEADISLISLPAAALSTVSVSVIVEDNDGRKGTVSGGEIVSPKTGDSSSGSGYLDWFIAESYEEDGETKYRLKLNPKYDGMYAEGWVSAGGVSDQGGGGGGITGYLKDLLDVNGSMIPVDGQALVWDSSLGDNGRWTSKNVSVDLTPFERTTNKVTSISSSSTDGQYPSARAVYNALSSKADSSTLSGYLPLTGGTMTGASNILNINSSSANNWIYFSSNNANKAAVGYYSNLAFISNEANYARIGVNDSGVPQYWSNTNPSTARTIWHAGNDGSGSGLDADLLDGLHAADFKKQISGYKLINASGWYRILTCKAYPASFLITFSGEYYNYPPTPVTFLISHSYNVTSITQVGRCPYIGAIKKIRVVHHDNYMFYIDVKFEVGQDLSNPISFTVTPLDNCYGELELIDFTLQSDGGESAIDTVRSISVADALNVPRSIWGQNFDGSADVSGSLEIFSTGGGWCEGIRIHPSNNLWSGIVLCEESNSGSTGTSANTWSIHNNEGTFGMYKNGSNTSASQYISNVNNTWLIGGGNVGINTPSPAYKLDVNGIIRGERLIGTATGITETSLEDEEFAYQATPINDIADGYRVDKIKGKTLVWNQLAKDLETQLFWATQYGSISNGQYDSGSVPSGAYGLATIDWTTLGHIYILSFYITNNATVQGWVGDANSVIEPNSSRVRKSIRLVPSAGNSRPLIGFNCDVNGATYQIGNVCLFDLTLMFGAGNEPETVEEFKAMFPLPYYAYNEGELINNSAEAIETEAADSSWTSRLALGLGSIKVKDSNGDILEFNGLASAGDVYDEIVGGKLIRRIGSVDLGTLNWASGGTNVYYSDVVPDMKSYSNCVCSKYASGAPGNTSAASDGADMTIRGGIDKRLYLKDSASLSMSGVMLYYELATPVTYELVSAVPLSGRIDGNGTMRVISDGPVAPFRGDITYGCNPGQMGADASSVKSYLDTMLEIKVVNGVPMLHTTLPFYSDSFVSAGGLSGTGGSGSGSSLRDLSDVQLPEIITTGSALVYNGEKWVQSDAAFVPQTRTVNGLELSSNISLSLGDLSNVNTAGASNGQSLVYYDGEWVPSGSGSGFLPLSGGSMTGTINMQTGSLTSTNTYKFTHTENGSEIFDAYFGANTNGLAAIYSRNGIALRPANASNRGLVVTGTDMTYNGATILKAAVNTPGMVQVSVVSAGDLTTILQIAESNTGISALDGKYRYYPVNISSDNKLYVHIPWYSGSGSGGSGSSVAYVPSLTSGTLIGTLKIDGSSYGLYAPAGGSGSASWGSTSKNTSPLTVGGTTKTVMLAGAATARDSSPTINTGGTTANRYYGVELSNDGKLFVNVPWIEGGGSTGSYLPLAGGTMTGTINSQSVIAKSNNAYDLGSSGKYYANTYTKKIYLDDGVYIYYDSTNRVIRVQGAGIAATGSVNAGGVSNT